MKKAFGLGKKMKMLAFCWVLVGTASILQFGIGTQAYASPSWDLTGSYTVHYYTLPDNVWIDHSMTIDSMSLQTGNFSGAGFINIYPVNTYTVTGSLTGSTLTLHYVYTAGWCLGSYGDETATIDNSGSFSGTYTGYNPSNHGTFWSTVGHATPLSYVPIPGAVWLLGSGLVGLLGLKLRKNCNENRI